MIPFLLFLLTIIILGGLIYLYLRKEQGKTLIPKDKYDEAWDEFYNQRKKMVSKTSLSVLLVITSICSIFVRFPGPFPDPLIYFVLTFTYASIIGISLLIHIIIHIFVILRAERVKPALVYFSHIFLLLFFSTQNPIFTDFYNGLSLIGRNIIYVLGFSLFWASAILLFFSWIILYNQPETS